MSKSLKRVLGFALALGLLGLCGCGQTTEPVTEPAKQPAPLVELPEGYEFTSTWAKTPTHFYAATSKWISDGEWQFALYHAPLSDISKRQEINLPQEYGGHTLTDIYICGVSPEGLYVSCQERPFEKIYCVVYRISLETSEVSEIDAGEYCRAPRYSPASDSLLFAVLNDSGYQLEALRLKDNKHQVIMAETPFTNERSHNLYWRSNADGMAVLESFRDVGPDDDDLSIVVDKDNRAMPIMHKDINYGTNRWEREPENEIERSLIEESNYRYATCGEYVYYTEYIQDAKYYNFYRINVDGTDKKLLRMKTNIRQLISTEGKLFCIAYSPKKQDKYGQSDEIGFYSLDKNGQVLKVLARGGEYDNGYGLTLMDGMVLMDNYVVYGGSEGYFYALYDPATGAIFKAE